MAIYGRHVPDLMNRWQAEQGSPMVERWRHIDKPRRGLQEASAGDWDMVSYGLQLRCLESGFRIFDLASRHP